MILIAPDKFKGTLTAREAASIIASELKDYFCLMAPMADGGEGTAKALSARNNTQWEEHAGYCVHRPSRTAAIDSSAWIGLRQSASMGGVMQASSAPLGLKVREILKGGCEKVIIGVGGTGTCDGGVGFLMALGAEHLSTYAERITGLCDVCAPLVSNSGAIDALSFAPQKGATHDDLPALKQRLLLAQRQWGHGRTSPFDGAGGGLGFAIASAIGAPCYKGAEYILDNYMIDWNQVEAVITGEGCIDEQTLSGKVVSTVWSAARDRGIPAIAIGGCVKDSIGITSRCHGLTIISAEKYKTSDALSPDEAAIRLRRAAAEARSKLNLAQTGRRP